MAKFCGLFPQLFHLRLPPASPPAGLLLPSLSLSKGMVQLYSAKISLLMPYRHFPTLSPSRNQPQSSSLSALVKRGFTPTVGHFNHFLLFLYRNKRFKSIILFFSQLKSNRIRGNSFTHSLFARALLKDHGYDEALQFLKTHMEYPICRKTRFWDSLIQGLCVHGKDPENALSLLGDILMNSGILPSSFTFFSLIHSFSCHGNMSRAIEVLEMMTDEKIKYPFDNFICSSVISGFVKIGKPELAVRFCENAVKAGALLPNVATYTALASAYFRMGRIKEVSDLVYVMENAGLAFDAVFYSSWIYEYFKEGIVEEAFLKYKEMVVRKIGRDSISYTVLIDGFSEEGTVEKAVGFLYKMKKDGRQPNLVTYTAIMLGFCKKGKLNEAFAVLNRMEDLGIEADKFTYLVLIDEFCRKGDFDRCFNLLEEMEKKGVRPNVVTYNTVINGLCILGRTSEADELSKNILRDAITYSTLLHRYIEEENAEVMLETKRRVEAAGVCLDVVLCNMLIKALLMVGSFKDAYEIYRGMRELDLEADYVTYQTMINGYCKAGRIDEALEIFDEFRRASIPSAACYNSIIHGLCKKRMVGMAIEVLIELNSTGLLLDEGTSMMLIRVLFEEKGIEGVLDFIKRMENLGSEMFDITGNAAILFLCKRGFPETAFDMYLVMKRKGSAISSRSYYSIVEKIMFSQNMWLSRLILSTFVKEYGIFEYKVRKAIVFYQCVNDINNALKFFSKTKDSIWSITLPVTVFETLTKNGKVLDAYQLFLEMEDNLPVMNVVDYSILIDGLCKGGLIDKALDLCAFVRKKGVDLNIVTYNSVINGLCCQGCIVEAFRLFDSLEKHGPLPSEITYATLIDALSKGGLLVDARMLFGRMVPKGFKPNTRIYNSLINGYCKFGQMQETLKLILDLEVNCLKPDGFTISSVINGYCEQGDMEGALRFFLEFRSKSMKPDFLGFVFLIRGLCAKGRMEESRSILREMLETRDVIDLLNGIDLAVEMESAESFLIFLCEQGRIQEALTILNEVASIFLARRSSIADHELQNLEESYDGNAFSKVSEESYGVKAFSNVELKSSIFNPDTVGIKSFSVNRSGCVAKNDSSIDTEKLFMQDFNSYYTMIASLCVKGELQKANQLAKSTFWFPRAILQT